MEEPKKIKRFYTTVSVEPVDGRFGIMLDGRAAKTPARSSLTAPTRALGNAIAAEWDGQEEFIDRNSMKMTALLSAAHASDDTVKRARRNILQYLGTDLLCYRATLPSALVERQKKSWDPFLDWFEVEFGAALKVTAGVGAIDQPSECAGAVSAKLDDASPEALTALSTSAAITGSSVLALAQHSDNFAEDEIFAAARLDEHFQEERWGVDTEAKAREKTMLEEFLTIGKFFRLLQQE